MAEVLRKWKSIVDVFGKSPLTRKNVTSQSLHRRSTSENNDVTPENATLGKRRVTFADIGELYTRYGADKLVGEIEEDTDRVRTNVGYINRNCAKQIRAFRQKQTEEDFSESVIGHLTVLRKRQSEGNHTKHRDLLELTFGRRGRDIGEFQDATDITHVSRDCTVITDVINGRIQLCGSDGEISAVYSGEKISEPWATCFTPEGHIALTSRRRKCVVVVSMDGDLMWSFGLGFFECPSGICVDSNGNFIVTDTFTHRVSVHDPSGRLVKYLGNPRIKEQQFLKPRYVCVSQRDDIIVSDSGHHCLKVFDKDGHFIRGIGKFGKQDGNLKTPYGVCTDTLGDILIADHYNDRVSMFTRDGAFICHVVDEKHGIRHPKGLLLTSDLKLFVTVGDLKASQVKVYKLKCSDPTEIVHV